MAFVIGDRSARTCARLWSRIPEGYQQGQSFSDFWKSYRPVFAGDPSHRQVGKSSGELAVLRGVLREWLSDMDAVTEENVGVLLDLQNVIRRTLGSINKIQTRSALTAAEVEFLQARVADLFKTYMPQSERDAAIRELREAIDPDGSRMN